MGASKPGQPWPGRVGASQPEIARSLWLLASSKAWPTLPSKQSCSNQGLSCADLQRATTLLKGQGLLIHVSVPEVPCGGAYS